MPAKSEWLFRYHREYVSLPLAEQLRIQRDSLLPSAICGFLVVGLCGIGVDFARHWRSPGGAFGLVVVLLFSFVLITNIRVRRTLQRKLDRLAQHQCPECGARTGEGVNSCSTCGSTWNLESTDKRNLPNAAR